MEMINQIKYIPLPGRCREPQMYVMCMPPSQGDLPLWWMTAAVSKPREQMKIPVLGYRNMELFFFFCSSTLN